MPEETDEVLRDIRRWVKIIGLQEAKPVLNDALSHEKEEKEEALRQLFHLTDGKHSTREIEKRISFSRGWIGDRYDEWSNMGIIERDSPNSSYYHVLTLEEAGMDIPDFPEQGESEGSE